MCATTKGLTIRVAKAANRMLARSGHVFADHYHSRLLKTPTELTRAIRHVIENAGHHYGDRGADFFSSRGADALTALVRPSGWLLRVGWSRASPRDRIEPIALRTLGAKITISAKGGGSLG